MRKIAGYFLAVVMVLAAWTITAAWVNSPVLPMPLDAIRMVAKHFDSLTADFAISMYRVLTAMFVGTVTAMPLGLAIGRSPRLDAIFGPLLYLLYPVPKIVFLPVLLVLLGLGNAPKIALIAITIFFQVLVTVRDAAKMVSEAAISSVQSLGANRLEIFYYVVLPASLPELFTALRISSGTAVAILFFAEAIAGSTGLGFFIVNSWALLNYPAMFAGIIVMALFGVLLYECFDLIERYLLRHRQPAKR